MINPFWMRVIVPLFLAPSSMVAQAIAVYGDPGNSTDVDGALDGHATLPDHLGGNNYSGFVGEVAIMPIDSSVLANAPTQQTMMVADSNGIYANRRGYVAFCIDSETSFNATDNVANNYVAVNFQAANSRYLSEGAAYYQPGSLKKAAYLIETFFSTARAGGNTEASALQAVIWESLYDTTYSLSTGNGNYYVRNNTANATNNTNASAVITLGNQWLNQAVANDWGGANYNPDTNVIFWLNPDNIKSNQSVISLKITGSTLVVIPEPASLSMVALGLGLVLRRKR